MTQIYHLLSTRTTLIEHSVKSPLQKKDVIPLINFHEIQLSDKNWIQPIINTPENLNCAVNFANIFLWSKHYNTKITHHKGFLLAESKNNNHFSYLFPQGNSQNINEIITDLSIHSIKKQKSPLRLYQLSQQNVDFLNLHYPDKFKFTENRNAANYIYRSEKLSGLHGKSLHSKRNHINQFRSNYQYVYENLNKNNLDNCIEMCEKWYSLEQNTENPGLKIEHDIIINAFKHFEQLELIGGALKIDGQVCAFCMGSKLSERSICIHFEKAFYHIRGAYNMINQKFAESIEHTFDFVNREEDLGDPGLRKSKLSYKPDILLKVFHAELIGNI